MSNIRQVACLAKVSIATVSRVMNEDTQFQVSLETKHKVLEAAKQLSYSLEKKQKSVQDNNKSKTLNAGVILNRSKVKYVDSFYMRILASFEEELNLLGGRLVFTKTVQELNLTKAELKAITKNLDGLILMECLPHDVLEYLQTLVPTIISIDVEHPELESISYDRMEAATMAMNYLMEKGHRRIAFIGGEEHPQNYNKEKQKGNYLFDSKRFWGYHYSLIKNKIEYDPSLVCNCNWNINLCRTQVQQIMSAPNPPTAILAASDTIAIAAICACGEMNLNIPQDVSIMGISDNEESKYSNPPLTTVRIPQDTMGLLAARTLVHPISGIPKTVLLPLTLIERKSVDGIVNIVDINNSNIIDNVENIGKDVKTQ